MAAASCSIARGRSRRGSRWSRLKFYKLRARATVEDLSADLGVMAIWDGNARPPTGLSYRDPRLPGSACAACWRPIAPSRCGSASGPRPADYEHRIALGCRAAAPISRMGTPA